MSNSQLRGTQCEPAIEIHDTSLMENRRNLKRLVLPALLHHPSADLENHNRRHQQPRHILDRAGELAGARSTPEVLQPRRRIDEVHVRSPSRSTVASRPGRNPRISAIARTGMNSIRFWYRRAWNFCPGSSPRASRISRGITTWN